MVVSSGVFVMRCNAIGVFWHAYVPGRVMVHPRPTSPHRLPLFPVHASMHSCISICPVLPYRALPPGPQANALQRLGRDPEALVALDVALAREPGYGAAHSEAGAILFKQREYSLAKTHLQKVSDSLQKKGLLFARTVCMLAMRGVAERISGMPAVRYDFLVPAQNFRHPRVVHTYTQALGGGDGGGGGETEARDRLLLAGVLQVVEEPQVQEPHLQAPPVQELLQA